MGKDTSAEVEIGVSKLEDVFILVPASELSLDDEFMKHQPKTTRELLFKERVELVIRKGVKNFYCAKYEPSYNKARTGICYKIGNMPAENKHFNWWEFYAKAFCPERGSRLGTRYEYTAFLAILIKKLIASGWTVSDAWHAVCNDSKELGHYKNSKNSKTFFETIDSREVCDFFGLANTYKILGKDKEGYDEYWLASGCHYDFGDSKPLADMEHRRNYLFPHRGVGWVVLEQ